MKIGTRSDCDLRIEPEDCNAISELHAVLFRDGKDNWEILNYSPQGLVVDGVRYGLSTEDDEPQSDSEPASPETNHQFEELVDHSEYSPTKPPAGQGKRSFEVLMTDKVKPAGGRDTEQYDLLKQRVHSIQGTLVCNDDKTLTWRTESTAPIVKKRKRQRETKACVCDDFESGWEAAAPINHGSLLEIGCHKFLFATH